MKEKAAIAKLTEMLGLGMHLCLAVEERGYVLTVYPKGMRDRDHNHYEGTDITELIARAHASSCD